MRGSILRNGFNDINCCFPFEKTALFKLTSSYPCVDGCTYFCSDSVSGANFNRTNKTIQDIEKCLDRRRCALLINKHELGILILRLEIAI